MTFWNFLRGAFHGRTGDYVQTRFKEMILVIAPRECATLVAEPGGRTVVTGFAGTVWIQVEGRELGYRLKHGESFEMPFAGELVFWAATENVSSKIHVIYYPPTKASH